MSDEKPSYSSNERRREKRKRTRERVREGENCQKLNIPRRENSFFAGQNKSV